MLSTGNHRHFPCPAHLPAAQPPAAGARAGSCPFHAPREKGDAPQRRAHSTADNEQGRPDSPTEPRSSAGYRGCSAGCSSPPAPCRHPSGNRLKPTEENSAISTLSGGGCSPAVPHGHPTTSLPNTPGHPTTSHPCTPGTHLRSGGSLSAPPVVGGLSRRGGGIFWGDRRGGLSPLLPSARQPRVRRSPPGGGDLWAGGGGGRHGRFGAGGCGEGAGLRGACGGSAPAPHPLRSAGGTAPPPSPSVPTRGHRRLLPGPGSRGARRAAGGERR